MPRIGGLGIFLAWAAGMAVVYWSNPLWFDQQHYLWLAGAILTFLLGFADDKLNLSPKIKFLGQFAIAGMLVYAGFCFPASLLPMDIPGDHYLLMALTFVWIVGVGNAINLIDGLDGLAGGLSLIALLGLSAIALIFQQGAFLEIALPLMGAILGFLIYNRHPARTFMGDCGSLFLGYMMATLPFFLPTLATNHLSLVVPVILLGTPIFDTVFAMTRRLLIRKGPFRADKEHLHHKLLRRGHSHGRVVHILYLFGAILASISLLITLSEPRQQAGLVLLVLFLGYRAIRRLGYAGGILFFRHNLRARWHRRVYKRTGQKPQTLVSTFYAYVSNRKWFQVIMDQVGLIAVWIFVLLLLGHSWAPYLLLGMAVHSAASLLAFTGLRCYSDIARYLEFATAGKYIKATLFAGLSLYVLMPLLPGGGQIGGRISILVTVGQLLVTLSSRLAQQFYFKFVKRTISYEKTGPKVLIYGSGDAGSTLLNLILEMDPLNLRVIGFVDDDPLKLDQAIVGYRVMGNLLDLKKIHEEKPFDILLLSTPNIPEDRLYLLAKISQELQFKVSHMNFELKEFFPEGSPYRPHTGLSHRDFYL